MPDPDWSADEAPVPPAGVAVRPARDEEPDRALLHRLYTTTFAHHWGMVEPDADRWWSTLRQGVGLDPAQWWIAELEGRILWMQGVQVEPEPGIEVVVSALEGI